MKNTMMKKVTLLIGLVGGLALPGKTQQIDSIFFNLYTDSLKKGTHNYINVDAKMSNGRWLPMTAKELVFSSSAFQFSGNELILPADCQEEKVEVKAVLRSNPSVSIQRIIWVKQLPDPELPAGGEAPVRRQEKSRRRG